MPKANWDDDITADDIDEAEDSFQPYAGEIPGGGVYRFKLRRAKFTEFSSGNKGFNILMTLDGSWKPEHKKFDGCPLWDTVAMVKSGAGFVKAFAAGIGVTSQDLISRVVLDEDDVVTKIGKLVLVDRNGDPTEPLVYVNVRRGKNQNTDEPRLDRAGAGYLVVDEDDADDDADDDEAPPAKPAKAVAKRTSAKAPKRAAEPEDEDDEPEDEPAPKGKRKPANAEEARRASKATAAKGKRNRNEDDEPPF